MKHTDGTSGVHQFVEAVRERAKIVELAGELTKLSSASRPTGLCPFHKEDGPSFTVYPEENRWKCYGCGKGGSVFDFVMEAEHIEFWDAVLRLADKYGIEVPSFGKKDQEAAAAEQAVRTFLAEYVKASHDLLFRHKEALEYLAGRGIAEDSIREHQIGYGATIKDAEMRKRGVAAGLIRVIDGKEYELQMGRLIFPVIHHGKVVQITGRTLKDHKPKYISLANAGQTPIVPMGSHRLRGRQCVIVEGAIDRILLEQAGIPACATISTNFQKEWLRWCGRETSFLMCYDADANQAGQTANEKVGRILFDAGHAVEVVGLPEGHDPASYVQVNGPEAFRSLMAQAAPYISYWIVRRPARPASGELQTILRQAYGLIAQVDRGVRGLFVRELAEKCSLTQGDVREGLSDYLRKQGYEKEDQSTCRETPNRTHRAEDRRPIIYADDDDLPAVTEKMWEAVRLANEPPQYFRQGGTPVRLRTDDNGAVIAQRFTLDIARYELTRIISWRRTVRGKNGNSEAEAVPPDNRWKNFLSVRDVPLPVLSRIVSVPVFAPGGSLQTEPGYHPGSKTYYVPAEGLELKTVSEKPTAEEVAEAKEIFEDIVCDFPFVGEPDKAHSFALWLLPFVRDMIGGPTPMHLIEAPTPGSGKTLLMDALVKSTVGPHIGSVAQASDDDEWRKRLTSIIVEGQPVLMLDNLTRTLDSGVVAKALVDTVWKDRILGRTETVDIPVRCVFICTANNPSMSTEIARRCIRIRIDPKMDRPWRREDESEFRHPDLRTYVEEHRAGLIWAALTIVRDWVSRGMNPYSGKVLGSYEQWTRVLGGICECAGVEGFLGNLLDLWEEADVEGEDWRAFVGFWWERLRDREVLASDLFEIAKEQDFFSFGKVSEHSQKISFGRKLSKQRDRVIGEYRVVQMRQKARALTWSLKYVGDGGPEDSGEDMPTSRELPPIEEHQTALE